MSDYRAILERNLDRIGPPDFGLNELTRRRDRKRRNDRFRAASVAGIVVIVATTIVFRAFHLSGQEAPASPITPDDVARLHAVWTVETGPAPTPMGSTVTIADGVVLVRSDKLYAYPETCLTTGSTCTPSWVANLPDPGNFFAGVSPDGPLVADGMAIVSAGDVYAFPLDCGRGGGECSPTWVGRVRPGAAYQPVVSGDTLYVGAGNGDDAGRLYAFPMRCVTSRIDCSRAWRSPVQRDPLLVEAVTRGVVYATNWGDPSKAPRNRVYTFPASCERPTCEPLSTWNVPNQHYVSIAASSSLVIAGSGDATSSSGELRGYRGPCAANADCHPSWSAHVNGAPTNPRPVISDGIVLVASRFGQVVRAFDSISGREGWGYCCADAISFNTPVVGDGFAWIPSSSVGVLAFAVDCAEASCEPAWSSGDPATGVAVTAQLVVTVSAGGRVTAYSVQGGAR